MDSQGIDMRHETIITLDEAAKRLKVTRRTIDNWINRQRGRRLEAFRAGGKVRTSLEALERFIEPINPPEADVRCHTDEVARIVRELEVRFGV